MDPSTVCRELQRNKGKRGSRPRQARNKACKRRTDAAKAIKMTEAVIALIESGIRLDWSPEQVSGRLKTEHDISISHERIYQHVWKDKRQGGTLYQHLRFCHKKRKKRYGSKDKRGQHKTV